jgi:predicted DNA-binding protein (MmcQ/YjbR family)
MTHAEIHEFLISFPKVWLDFPFGDDVSVYKIGHEKTGVPARPIGQTGGGKMFALIAENSNPLRLSLKCDPLLAEKLREEYETVLPGYHLNKKNWNTIICTGQVSDDELKGFIRLSYDLVTDGKTIN